MDIFVEKKCQFRKYVWMYGYMWKNFILREYTRARTKILNILENSSFIKYYKLFIIFFLLW